MYNIVNPHAHGQWERDMSQSFNQSFTAGEWDRGGMMMQGNDWGMNHYYTYADGVPTLTQSLMGMVVWLIGAIIIALLSIGLTKIYLKVSRHETVHLRNIFDGEDRFVPFVLSTILSGLFVFIGLIAFILPGLYIAMRLSLTKIFVVDKHVGPLEAISLSWNATRGQTWQIFGFVIVTVLVNLLGALAFGIGLLFTLPLSMLAYINVYEKLAHRHAQAA